MNTKSQSRWTCAFLMVALLQGAWTSAAAYTTQTDVRHLREEVEQIRKQLDLLEASADAKSDAERVANHLELVDGHLQSVRVLICGECKGHSFIEPEYRRIAESCGQTERVSSSRSMQDYIQAMRQELHGMGDHLARMMHETSPFKRDRQLRWYYRHVISALDSAKPQCQEQ